MIVAAIMAFLLAQDTTRPQDLETGFYYNASHGYHLEQESVTAAYGGLLDGLHVAISDNMLDDPAGVRLLKYMVSGWGDSIIETAAHEYGHISSLSRVGFTVDTDTYMRDSKYGETNPARVLLAAVRSRPATVPKQDDWDRILSTLSPEKFRAYNALVAAGGLNQEQLMANRYVERYLEGELSRLDSFVILWANTSTGRYPLGGDLDLFVENVGSTSINTIKNYAFLRIFSGSSLMSILGTFEGISGVSGGYIKPLRLKIGDDVSLFWPEIQSYLTLTGPSIKTIMPVKIGSMLFLPSVEASHGAEGGLKAQLPIASFLSLKPEVYHSATGNWFEASAEIRPLQWLGLYAGYAYGHGQTMHEDVFGATMNNTERSILVGANVHFVF